MILFYKNGNTLKIHNPSAETKYYQMPSVNSVLATEDDLTKVTTVSSAIKQPVILTPANNSTGFNGDITFTSFETIETFTGTLDAISIAIATDVDFTNTVVLQRVETTDASSFNIAVDLSSSDLYIKVKYHSDLYSSVWSNPVKTTTPEYIINKPTILGPTNGQTGVALFPMISGSDFTYVGVDETHESTTYQIAKDVAFTNIAYNVTSTTDLTSHLITEDLDYETTYYIRMRYNGSKYGNSEWSNTIVIDTLDIEEKIVLFNDSRLVSSTIVTPIINNSYYFVLVQDNSSTGNTNVLVKYNLNNEVLLAKKISMPNINRTGGGNVYYHNNNLYVTIGVFTGTGSYYQSAIVKLDLSLNILKCVQIRSTNSNSNQIISSGTNLTFIGDEIYQHGHYYDGIGVASGIFFIKYDLNLNKLNHLRMVSGTWSFIPQIIDLGTNLLVVVSTYVTNTTFRKISLLIIRKSNYSKVKEISILNPTNTHVNNFNVIKNSVDKLVLITRLTNNINTVWKYITLDYNLNIIKDEKLDTNKNFNINNINIVNNTLTGVGNKFPIPNVDAHGGYASTTNGQIIISGNVNDNTIKMLEIDNYLNLLVDYNIDNNKYLLQGYKTSAIINISTDYINVNSNGYMLNTRLINIVTNNTTVLTTENLYSTTTATPVINTVTGVTLTDVDYFNNKTEILI
jgi:hypothetical protein